MAAFTEHALRFHKVRMILIAGEDEVPRADVWLLQRCEQRVPALVRLWNAGEEREPRGGRQVPPRAIRGAVAQRWTIRREQRFVGSMPEDRAAVPRLEHARGD